MRPCHPCQFYVTQLAVTTLTILLALGCADENSSNNTASQPTAGIRIIAGSNTQSEAGQIMTGGISGMGTTGGIVDMAGHRSPGGTTVMPGGTHVGGQTAGMPTSGGIAGGVEEAGSRGGGIAPMAGIPVAGGNTGGTVGGMVAAAMCNTALIELCTAAEPASLDGDGTEANPMGERMRLELTEIVSCDEMRVRVTHIDNTPLEPGTYDLRAGSCQAFGPIRTTEVLENPSNALIFYPVEHLGALDEVKSFCVTKREPTANHEDNSAWWWSNLVRVNREEICQPLEAGQANVGGGEDVGGRGQHGGDMHAGGHRSMGGQPIAGSPIDLDLGGQVSSGGQPGMGGRLLMGGRPASGGGRTMLGGRPMPGGRPINANLCNNRPDGALIRTGQWTPCGAFSDLCDEIGFRMRTNLRCQNGQTEAIVERAACRRITENRRCGPMGQCRNGQCVDVDIGPRCRVRRLYPENPRLYTDGECNAGRFRIYQARADDPNGNQVNLLFRRCEQLNDGRAVDVKYWISASNQPPANNDLCINDRNQACNGCCRSQGQWPAAQDTLPIRGLRIFDDGELQQNGTIKHVYIQSNGPGQPDGVSYTQDRAVRFQVQCQ